MHTILHLFHYVWPFLLVLTTLVSVHELGHYWIARWNGVKVEAFSIGFGPELFGYTSKKTGTRWKFALIPLGGYVKMFGDVDAASRPSEAVPHMTPAEKAVSFHHKSPFRRAAILIGGPGANFLLAVLMLMVLLSTTKHPFPPAVIDSVQAGGLAQQAGLRPGDRILDVDGKSVNRFAEVSETVANSKGRLVSFRVLRSNEIIAINVTPKLETVKTDEGKEITRYRIGIKAETGPYPLQRAIPLAFSETGRLTWSSLVGLKNMIFHHTGLENLGGPLRIAEMSGDAVSAGFSSIFWLIAFLSISLGLLNIFPIPMLDGGHILYCLIEAVRGKPLSFRIQEYGFRIGAVLVLTLMAFAFWNDLSHLQIFGAVE